MKNKKIFHEKVEPIIALIVLCFLIAGFAFVSEYNDKQEDIPVKVEQQENK